MVRGKRSTVALKAASCPAWVMPSADGAGYYRFSMATEDAAKLEANFDRLGEREQRAYADSAEAAFQAGALDLGGFIRAARRLAASPARETAMAPARTLQWALTRLADSESRRTALRALAHEIYAPRLAVLGTEVRPSDRDEDGILRRELLTTLADLGRDPALRQSLAGQGRRVLGLAVAGDTAAADGQLHPGAVSANHRSLALRMAAEEGDASVFDALLAAAAGSEDAVLRGELLGAAASSKALALQQRARELALTPKVRRNEIALLVSGSRRRGGGGGNDEDADSLAAARSWVDANFEALVARVAPAGVQFVGAAAQGLCTEAEADAFEARYAAKVSQLEGGPRALAQATEVIRLCGALQSRHKADAWPL
jgi:alanyl aminopeptidase